jgi:AraC family ethanolamine operon transcriptional activator
MLSSNLRHGQCGQYSIESHVAHEAWVHSTNIASWSHIYEPVRPGPFHGLFTVAWLGPVQILYERVDHAFNYRGHAWPGSRLFFSYLTGSGNLFYDFRSLSAGALTTHRWDAVERVSCSRYLELALVAIDENFLNEHIASVYGRELFGRDGGPVTYSPGGALVGRFQRCVLDVLSELGGTPALLQHEHARRNLQQRMLQSITDIVTARPDGEYRLPPPSTRAYVVDRAIGYMHSRLADPISISDVCAEVRVCPRTLGYSFGEVLGVSPSRYLLAARLNRVRRDLATAGAHASIQSVAARWGFWHMGRFAQYYRQAFGERPSETCRMAGERNSSAPLRPPVPETAPRPALLS